MHPSTHFRETSRDVLLARMEAHPFAVVVGAQGSRPRITHTPVIVDPDGALRFHIARANPLDTTLRETGRALLVFTGDHAYISPDSYGLPDQVPTWNYLSTEAEGPVEVLDDTETRTFLADLSATFEAGLAPKPPWTPGKTDPEALSRMLAAITAYRLDPDRLEGTTKLNQNKPASARQGVIEALGQHHPIARAMRELD